MCAAGEGFLAKQFCIWKKNQTYFIRLVLRLAIDSDVRVSD